ncbi:MAG: glucose-6-phosphate dehydrogenase assembly protein OpcA [Microbacteriaceae bacterium]|jgi:glucose-6-phosphate dehydrogenase assembly protein OpcA|nr:glucose-6-phosphate dehydrogenase assembly protein OpcA [Microbacteriaceae bacterium]
MIERLDDTDLSAVAKRLVLTRRESGANALGRVLTLVVSCAPDHAEMAAETAVAAAREHPMRVLVLSGAPEGRDRLDAEIRVGEDAGASEVVLLHATGEMLSNPGALVTPLLLADTPIVVWWPDRAPASPSSCELGSMATRRVTDCAVVGGLSALSSLASGHRPGDTDLSWARLTPWRDVLASELDQPPHEPVLRAQVSGDPRAVPCALMAAWLGRSLNIPVALLSAPEVSERYPLVGVSLERAGGTISLRLDAVAGVIHLSHPHQPDHEVSFPERSLSDCLAEELRNLGPDPVYTDTLTGGVPALVEAEHE